MRLTSLLVLVFKFRPKHTFLNGSLAIKTIVEYRRISRTFTNPNISFGRNLTKYKLITNVNVRKAN